MKRHTLHSQLQKLHPKDKGLFRIISIVAIGILFLAVVGLGYLIVTTLPLGKQRTDEREARLRLITQDDLIKEKATKALQAGDSVAAKKYYSEAIKEEASPDRKVQLLISESSALYASGNYSEAIRVAKSAESVSSDKFLVADWLSRIYEDQQLYTLSSQYYSLAGKWASSPMNKAGMTEKYYSEKALSVLEQNK